MGEMANLSMDSERTQDPFLPRIPIFASFADIADQSRYLPVPDTWLLGLSDVVSSTAAIAAGKYKSVNMAGAAVISALSNAVGHGDHPFVFGGDGASFAVGPDHAETARKALAATATLVREEFELELRIGLMPVSAIRAAGHDLRVARFAPSPNVAYAMFSGGGLAWAEAQLKAGLVALEPAPAGTRPDLTGLSCRFEASPAKRGLILSLIVRPGADGHSARYGALIRAVLGRIESSAGMASPVQDGGPPLGWPPTGLSLEVRTQHRPGRFRFLQHLRLLARSAGAAFLFKSGLSVGRFNPGTYLAELVANTDYRKYDDGLRMTIDCAPALADAVEAMLVEAAAAGTAIYGLHRQEAALMTCFTPSVYQNDHIHFVDGAAGGYAAAAADLKAVGA